jgi:hypothetical protein
MIYIDCKSPYAYLAVEPTRELEREPGVTFDWRPFELDIPSYLGSARLDKEGELDVESWPASSCSGTTNFLSGGSICRCLRRDWVRPARIPM